MTIMDTSCRGEGCPRADLCRRYTGARSAEPPYYFAAPPLQSDGMCVEFVSNGWVRKDPFRCGGAHPLPRCSQQCSIDDAEQPWMERRLGRDQRQRMIADWAIAAFGKAEATGIPQRGLRLLEEAIEVFQACGGDEAIAHKLVAYVFGRPPGAIGQELGGVAVTVLALAAAAGLSADEEECREVHRVLSKPLREFSERNASKNEAGFKIS